MADYSRGHNILRIIYKLHSTVLSMRKKRLRYMQKKKKNVLFIKNKARGIVGKFIGYTNDNLAKFLRKYIFLINVNRVLNGKHNYWSNSSLFFSIWNYTVTQSERIPSKRSLIRELMFVDGKIFTDYIVHYCQMSLNEPKDNSFGIPLLLHRNRKQVHENIYFIACTQFFWKFIIFKSIKTFQFYSQWNEISVYIGDNRQSDLSIDEMFSPNYRGPT